MTEGKDLQCVGNITVLLSGDMDKKRVAGRQSLIRWIKMAVSQTSISLP